MRIFAASLLFVFVAAACSGPGADVFGADLYSSSCAHCHGSDLAGGIGPPLGPGSNAAILTDEQIIDVIRIGPGAMTSFGDRFTDVQLESLVEYLRAEQIP
jgi:mono/diheme cytochrome c family protein